MAYCIGAFRCARCTLLFFHDNRFRYSCRSAAHVGAAHGAEPDEISALARAGVPLDRGLRELAVDMPGRLGRLADQMGRQLEQGQRLDDVVAELGETLPPAYRAVIEAGMSSGRLPAAMEDISRTARRLDQLRNTIYLSLLYPLVVLMVAWGLSVFMLTRLGPILSRMLVDFEVTGPWIIEWYAAGARHIGWLGPLVPIAFMLWLLWAWHRCGRVAAGLELHPLLSLGQWGRSRTCSGPAGWHRWRICSHYWSAIPCRCREPWS